MQAFGLAQADRGLEAIERLIHAAAEQQADLLVLPECAYPAYLIESQDNFRRAAVLPAEEYVIRIARLARKKRLHIASGLIEDTHTCLHNSAVLIDAAGQVIGTYRKSFLWGADNDYFTPGDRPGVFDTELGRIGLLICADARAPEVTARAVMGGAALMAMPTCWVNLARESGRFENPQPEYLIPARSREFGVPFICANKFGRETQRIGYCGRSLIADRRGTVLSEAPGEGEFLGLAEVECRDSAADPYTANRWDELLSTTEARRLPPARSDLVTVGLVPGSAALSGQVRELLQCGAAMIMAGGAAAAGFGGSDDLLLPEPLGEITPTVIGRVGRLRGPDVAGFAGTRLLALQGLDILCVFDAPDDLQLLRARAVENRIFVFATGAGGAAAIAPDGSVLGQTSGARAAPLCVQMKPADASVKTVFPGTDIWEQRRVEAYR
jgi:predicted amidohydrolase